MITLQLTYPPSANRIWRNINGKTLKSQEYRDWLEENVLVNRAKRLGVIRGRYTLSLKADRPDRRARDLDNLLKPASDALAAIGVIENDSNAKAISAFWGADEPVKPAMLTIILEPAT